MRTVGTSLVVLALFAAATLAGDTKGKDAAKKPVKKFTVGKETTYVTGPLDKDGYIDYAAALNKRLGKGVTPGNNATVLLWKALGPHPEGATMPPEFFKWLGSHPPEKGDYFVPLHRYLKDRLKLDPGKVADELTALHDRATQRPWTATDYPILASWLKANEKPIAIAIEATKRSHYFSPLTPLRNKRGTEGLMAARLPAVQGCRELTSAFVGRAMLRLAQGDADGAWQDLLACHRLGRLVGRGGTLIEGLVGIAIDSIAARGDLAFLDQVRPDGKRLENCLRDLRRLPPLPPTGDKVELAQRFTHLEAVLMVARHGLQAFEGVSRGPLREDNPLAELVLSDIQWDPALRNVNRWYDRLAEALRHKDCVVRDKKLAQLDAEVKALYRKVTAPKKLTDLFPGGKVTPEAKGKVVGDILISLLLPAVRKVQQADDRARQTQANLTVAFALAWYRHDRGRYPEKLESLAPKYLTKVPQDRFSGKPLVYRPTEKGYLLYSVGPNGKDEGGRGYGDLPAGDDLAVRMPPSAPQQK